MKLRTVIGSQLLPLKQYNIVADDFNNKFDSYLILNFQNMPRNEKENYQDLQLMKRLAFWIFPADIYLNNNWSLIFRYFSAHAHSKVRMPIKPDPPSNYKVDKAELRQRLDPIEYMVTQEKGTER